MGYEVHITRQDNWSEKDAVGLISEAEWRALVEGDAEMRLVGAAEATSPSGEVVRIESKLLAEWLGHPTLERIWFDFWGGNIVVVMRKENEPVLLKMIGLAEHLGAQVQGDEGEFY